MGHKSAKELNELLFDAKQEVEVGGIYYHYKTPDKFYVVESIGFMEEAEEVCVVYRALYDKGLVWVRTVTNFREQIGGNLWWGPRFIKLEKED